MSDHCIKYKKYTPYVLTNCWLLWSTTYSLMCFMECDRLLISSKCSDLWCKFFKSGSLLCLLDNYSETFMFLHYYDITDMIRHNCFKTILTFCEISFYILLFKILYLLFYKKKIEKSDCHPNFVKSYCFVISLLKITKYSNINPHQSAR